MTENGAEQVVVATCDCGNQWLPGDSHRGCWACNTALKSDKIRTDRYVRAASEHGGGKE